MVDMANVDANNHPLTMLSIFTSKIGPKSLLPIKRIQFNINQALNSCLAQILNFLRLSRELRLASIQVNSTIDKNNCSTYLSHMQLVISHYFLNQISCSVQHFNTFYLYWHSSVIYRMMNCYTGGCTKNNEGQPVFFLEKRLV